MAIKMIVSFLFLHSVIFALALTTPAPAGLSLNYYDTTCPSVSKLVSQVTSQYITRAPTLAASVLRMHFHDCFVRGCDGSVLIKSPNNDAERNGIPNLTLRGFEIINAAKTKVEKKCPGIVSCADILALVARDAVSVINGPYWDVPLGRRDGNVSIAQEANGLPPPFGNITTLKQMFALKGLNAKDLVVLSGGHTIGISHCPAIIKRLYNFSGNNDTDPSLDPSYAAFLKKKCKPNDLTSTVQMDPKSFKSFDTHYYTTVSQKRGLFQSDAALLDDVETKNYVLLQAQAANQWSTFESDFARSMIKLGQIGIRTGNDGQIRKICTSVN